MQWSSRWKAINLQVGYSQIAGVFIFPRYLPAVMHFEYSGAAPMTLHNQPVSVINPVELGPRVPLAEPDLTILVPDRVVTFSRPRFGMVPAWCDLSAANRQRFVCGFPPNWERLCGLILLSSADAESSGHFPSQVLWNANNLVVKAVAPEDLGKTCDDRLFHHNDARG